MEQTKIRNIIFGVVGFLLIVNTVTTCSIKSQVNSAKKEAYRTGLLVDSLQSRIVDLEHKIELVSSNTESVKDNLMILNGSVSKINPKISVSVKGNK